MQLIMIKIKVVMIDPFILWVGFKYTKILVLFLFQYVVYLPFTLIYSNYCTYLFIINYASRLAK